MEYLCPYVVQRTGFQLVSKFSFFSEVDRDISFKVKNRCLTKTEGNIKHPTVKAWIDFANKRVKCFEKEMSNSELFS